MPDASATFRPGRPLDLRRTLGTLRLVRRDPAMAVRDDGVWRASRTPEGPATVRFRAAAGVVKVEAWGPGATWAVHQAPELVGEHEPLDGLAGVARRHPLVRELHRCHPGVRVVRSRRVLEAMVPTICSQKVTGFEANESYLGIVRRWGEPAPGPAGAPRLRLAPAPEALARVPSFAFHPLGLERTRAETVLRACAVAQQLEAASDLPAEEGRRRLRAVPGVGVWSSAEVAFVALGDADAVSVGDYHLKNVASFHLAGEPRGTDERMLELLEPFRPYRGVVMQLLAAAGRAPRYGPRMTFRGFQDQ